jgi:hypothetical protein
MKKRKGDKMIKFDLEFDSLDEVYDVAQLLLDLEKHLDNEELIMKKTKLIRGEYEIALLYGYEELEECIVRRCENV